LNKIRKQRNSNNNNFVWFYLERTLQKAISKSTVKTVIGLAYKKQGQSSRAKEVFYASPRTCSSAQSKEEPPAHFEKCVCLFLALGKVTMVLKTF